jgi:hypothetical protein
MAGYPVIEPLRHDGRDYAPGDVVELTDEQAEPMRQSGVIGEALPDAAVKPAKARK